jgi:tight adherence protein C
MEYKKEYIKKLYIFFIPILIGGYIFNLVNRFINLQLDYKLRNKFSEFNFSISVSEKIKIHWSYRLFFITIFILIAIVLIVIFYGDFSILFFTLTIGFGFVYYPDNKLNKLILEKKLSIQTEFPEFTNRLTILLNTGMTTSKAWITAYRNIKLMSPFKREVFLVLEEIAAGKSETQAFEAFASRCRNSEVTRFISVLIQNQRKGNSELVMILKIQSRQCWEMRKNAARKLGEEAAVKMLLPMIMMFGAVLIIVIFPGVLALMSAM